jgi:hypothetical protein
MTATIHPMSEWIEEPQFRAARLHADMAKQSRRLNRDKSPIASFETVTYPSVGARTVV